MNQHPPLPGSKPIEIPKWIKDLVPDDEFSKPEPKE